MCTKQPSPKNQETQVLIHLPQPPIHHLTSLGLFLKCQIKMENMYLLLYKFAGRIKRKSTGFLINVLTVCSVVHQISRSSSSLKTDAITTEDSLLPSSQPLTPPLYSMFLRLTIFDASYKWNHAIFIFLCLAYFTFHLV